jgi:NAD(P)-dependent dehydrogenase (short-subunit alcohol dehydrogenase family)
VERPDPGTVLVTGGSSGLGAAVMLAVAECGGRPVVLDRRAPRGDSAWEQVDLADARAAERAVRTASEKYGPIDAVVTCAGVDACGPIDTVPAEDWERVVAVNLLGTAAVVRAALPDLRARGGHVVTVASTLGLRGVPDATAYCASKFGVVGFTRALAAELAGQVGVTLLVPGGMATSFFDDRDPQYRPPADATMSDPQRMAEAVVFALAQPPDTCVRELVVCPAEESSWP